MLKAGKNLDETEEAQRARRLAFPQMTGSGGYAIPRQPIRVVLARDEEAAGLDSETTKISPPAYGLWRESVVSGYTSCLPAIDKLTIVPAGRPKPHLLGTQRGRPRYS
jgi:hypothetical protein